MREVDVEFHAWPGYPPEVVRSVALHAAARLTRTGAGIRGVRVVPKSAYAARVTITTDENLVGLTRCAVATALRRLARGG